MWQDSVWVSIKWADSEPHHNGWSSKVLLGVNISQHAHIVGKNEKILIHPLAASEPCNEKERIFKSTDRFVSSFWLKRDQH